jgi:predicted lysophospholipase L1 biosynthesis ABC-type transport system permease subunit
MAKKLEVREGDTLTIKVRVSRVSDDGDKVTINVLGQPFTAPADYLDIVRHEKGVNWPG